MSRRILNLTVLLIFVFAIIIVILKHNQQQTNPLPPQQSIDTKGQPTLDIGKNPKLHIVAFEDLKCSNCRRYNMELYPLIKQRYIDTGLASYTTVPLAFIPGSVPAANAALCMNEQGTNYFYAFAEYVFEHQPDENLDWATKDRLLSFASHIPGANLTALASCIDSQRYYPRIQSNLLLAEDVMHQLVATPCVFVNGYKLNQLNLPTFEQLTKKVS